VKAERRRRESVFSFDFVEVFRRRKRASVGVGPERLERGAGEETTSERRTVSFRKKEPAVASKEKRILKLDGAILRRNLIFRDFFGR
jgi:hypothetical protein